MHFIKFYRIGPDLRGRVQLQFSASLNQHLAMLTCHPVTCPPVQVCDLSDRIVANHWQEGWAATKEMRANGDGVRIALFVALFGVIILCI